MNMRPLRPIAALAAIPLLMITLSSCGGDDQGDGSDATLGERGVAGHVRYDDADILDYLGLLETVTGDGQTTLPDGESCSILLLTSEGSVEMYADAGDTVAVSPDGSVGGRISSSSEKSCFDLITDRLSKFPPSDPSEEGVLAEGPSEASAAAMLGFTQSLFNEDQYERACKFSQAPAYLERSECAGEPRKAGQVPHSGGLWDRPHAIDVQVSEGKGTVTYEWNVPSEAGPPTTTKFLQHDGTRWWITGDKETGDLGLGEASRSRDGATKASAESMLRESQRLFAAGKYEEACEYGQSPAYLAVEVDCAEGSREIHEQIEAAGFSIDPVETRVRVSGTKGKVTFTWDFPANDGAPATSFQYLRHDGTRWWITGDSETGDLGVG